MFAAHEPLVRPGGLEDLVELRLAHDVPAAVPLMEHLDGLVERRPVDDRVVRGKRYPQHVGVLVLERAGQVVVDLVEAQGQRLLDRPARCLRPGGAPPRTPPAGRAGSAGATPAPGTAAVPGQVEGLEHERRDPPDARPAVVGRVRQDQLVARPGHRDVAEPALLGEGELRARGATSAEGRGQRQRLATSACRETGRRRARAGTPPGTRGPWPCGRSGPRPRRASGSRSAVAGSSPASISVCEVRREEDRAIVGEQR